jgi:hypothetical protein
MFNAIGYDETLYSHKSRVFIVTFHASEDIRVRIGDAYKTDLNEKAINLMMADHLSDRVANNAREDGRVVVFRKYHDAAYANTYAAVNKTGRDVIVELDMTSSTSQVFMPSSGVISVKIPAHGLKYLGSCIVHPDATSFRAGYTFSSRDA